MSLSVRTSSIAIVLVAAVAAACSDEPTGSNTVPLSRILGNYQCEQAVAFYSKGELTSDGPGTYVLSPCRIYGNWTVPQRRDSIEVYNFELREDSTVLRFDYPQATFTYDEETGVVRINNPSHPQEVYGVLATPNNVALQRTLIFDFDGDLVADTLQLTFIRD